MPRNESAQITTGNDRTQVIHMRQQEMKEVVDKLTDTKAILDYQPGCPEQENIP
ncbi:hypothetical protein AB5G42_001827 [Salmonella enterica subsp. enterica serovar Teko]